MSKKGKTGKKTGEQQVCYVFELFHELKVKKLELKEINDAITGDVAKLRSDIKTIDNDESIGRVLRKLDGFDAKECRSTLANLSANATKAGRLKRRIEKAVAELQKKLMQLFNVNKRLEYSCDVNFETETVHLYSFIAGEDVNSDKNHGHYGIDFSKKTVFARDWGNRDDKKNITESFKIESFLKLKNASW